MSNPNAIAGRLLGAGERDGEPRKVAMFAGSLSCCGRQEHEMGFRHVAAERFLDLAIVELPEMGDDRERACREALTLPDSHGDLAAIDDIGAGKGGVTKALRERGAVFPGREPTEGTRRLLLEQLPPRTQGLNGPSHPR